LSVEFERSQCNKYSLEVAAEVPFWLRAF